MAIKKSELYSTLWKCCDELRGGMDGKPIQGLCIGDSVREIYQRQKPQRP